jgi:hypothetical protein
MIMTKHTTPNHTRLDRVVAEARQQRDSREQGYRERAMKLFPIFVGAVAASLQERVCTN